MERPSESGLAIIKGQVVSLPTSGLSPQAVPFSESLFMLTALSATILLVSLFLFYINKNAKMALVLFVGNLFLLSSFLIESEDDLLDRCHSGDQAACTDLQHMSDSRLKRAYNSLQEQ